MSDAFLLTSVLPEEHVHTAWLVLGPPLHRTQPKKFTPYDTSILAYVNKNRIHYNYNMVVSLIQSVKNKIKNE